MKIKWMIVSVIFSVLLIGCAIIGPIMSDVERPQYKVITASNNIEVREYAPMIIAEVKVQGERKQTIKEGFRLLADYIFGNNTSQQAIAMTAPVQQQANEKIAMTAPVQQQREDGAWTVSFVMPSEYTMESLPKPDDDRVKLKKISARRVVAIVFSGTHSAANIAEHEHQLIEHMVDNHVQPVGPPQYAFYNPPWTLPFMRRNEIIFEVENSQ